MKLKKGFTMGCYNFKVVYVKEIFGDEGEPLSGMVDFNSSTIKLALTMYGKKVSKDYLTHSFYHEVAHILAIFTGQDELNNNEPIIDIMGQFLYQLEKTMKTGEVKIK